MLEVLDIKDTSADIEILSLFDALGLVEWKVFEGNIIISSSLGSIFIYAAFMPFNFTKSAALVEIESKVPGTISFCL